MRPVALAGILLSTTMLGGCAGTIAGVTLSSISSYAGFASTIFTGADLGEHAASLVTGKDCRFSEGLMRADRDICEVPGSLATRDDFHGIFIERIDADGTIIYAAPKYMASGVGMGENESTPDRLWAEIKTQKAKEENERQLARTNTATQTIDVAALATGSLSSESLAFLPAGTNAADIADGETASQTASAPVRPVVNAAAPKAEKRATTTAAADLPLDQPAIEEVALTAPLKAAKENGQGGPLITLTGSSAPVTSKLVHGEPVVILRLQPMISAASIDTASAEPSAIEDDASTVVALPARSATVPSPLAVLNQAQPVAFAAVEPQLDASRPRTKPTPVELAPVTETVVEEVAVEKPKQVRRKRTEPAAPKEQDVYQPPAREADLASSTMPDLIAASPVHVPGDIPAAPMPSSPAPVATYVPSTAPSEAAAPATSGPAPLYPIAQP